MTDQRQREAIAALKAGEDPAQVLALLMAEDMKAFTLLKELVAGLNDTSWSSWQTTHYFYPQLKNAEAYVQQRTQP